jgi:hypothetical protein
MSIQNSMVSQGSAALWEIYQTAHKRLEAHAENMRIHEEEAAHPYKATNVTTEATERSRKRLELIDRMSISTNKYDAQAFHSHLDANKDGLLTKEELTQSLESLSTNLENKKSVYIDFPPPLIPGFTAPPSEQNRDESTNISALNRMKKAVSFGKQLLENYEKIAKLDDQAGGVSVRDLSLLASMYGGNDNNISYLDFYTVETSA